MKKYLGLFVISFVLSIILIIASKESFNLVTNQNFFEISKNNNTIYLLTNANNEYIKMRILHLLKNKKCNINTNKVFFENNSVEIWEIDCEK